jgi:L-rhamnose-H+ transport protein
MNPFFGVFLHSVGGFSAASFYIPFRRVREWAWESYWLIQGVAAWLIMPVFAAALTAPDLWNIFLSSPAKSMVWAYIFGVLWGIGGLTFGLSMRYLGMSLGYALTLGFCAAFGTLIPPIFKNEMDSLVGTLSGWVILAGVGVCLTGIAVCGYAGIRKEKELTDEQKREAVKEYSLKKGLIVAFFSGVMSACFAFAISAGEGVARAAIANGTPPVFQNNPVFILIMAGGFTTNCIWCLALNMRNRSIRDYISGSSRLLIPNYLLSALAGVIWYGQFFFYGMGTTKMGKYDFSSWSIHMAFIIVFSNLWGIYFKEWKHVSRRTWVVILAGLTVLILSTVIIGWGNFLAAK